MKEGTKYRKEDRHTWSVADQTQPTLKEDLMKRAFLLLLSSDSFFRVTESNTLIPSLLCSTQPSLKPYYFSFLLVRDGDV